jgi:hypothetical protein
VITRLESGIFRIECEEDVVYDVQMVRENLSCIRKLAEGKLVPVYSLAGKYTLATKEAREYVAKAEMSRTILSAEAFVVQSASQRIIANFYLRINKPRIPTAFFKKEEDAVKWLKKFL